MVADQTSGGVTQLPSRSNRLIVRSTFTHVRPEPLFPYWIDPELLTRWWPPQAETDPRAGGTYHLAWPSTDWHLRGTYSTFQPPEHLSFTWRWDHGDSPARTVDVILEPQAGGTVVTLTHGEYSESGEDQDERQGHLAGWTSFLGKLQAAVGGE